MISNLFQKVLVSTTVSTVIGFSTILGAMSSASALTVESESFNKKGKQQDISHIAFFIKDNSGDVTKVKIDSVSGTKSYDATNFLKTYYPDSEVVAYQVKASTNKSFVALSEGYSEDNLPTKNNSADKTYQYSKVYQMQPSQKEPAPSQPEEKSTPNQVEPAPSQPEEKSTPNQVEDNSSDSDRNKKKKAKRAEKKAKRAEMIAKKRAEMIAKKRADKRNNNNSDTQSKQNSDQDSTPTSEEQTFDTPPVKNTYVEAEEPSTKKVSVPEPGSIAAIAIFGLGGLLRRKKISS